MRYQSTVTINKNFAGFQNAIMEDAAAAAYMVAEEVMTDSKMNYVPVVNGFLRMSGQVGKPKIEQNRITIQLGYGGPTTVGVNVTYALKVHEAPDHHGQQKNKYLVKPLYAAVPRMPKFISIFMAERLRARGSFI
jgi:hypothetical protein